VTDRPRIDLISTVLGTPDPRALATFYEKLLGWPRGSNDEDWVTLRPGSGPGLSFQLEETHERPTWPQTPGEQQMQAHLDFQVDDLDVASAYAVECGATVAEFQPQSDVRVHLDPDGHPFCLFL
jgi:catechol 2,3-dioxygenase-like lactoylglutathione lyase family enzyme